MHLQRDGGPPRRERATVGKPASSRQQREGTAGRRAGLVSRLPFSVLRFLPSTQKMRTASPIMRQQQRFRPFLDGRHFALSMLMSRSRRFVYILNSESEPTRYYTGITENVCA